MDLKMEVYTPSLELIGFLEIQRSVIWEDKAFSAGSFSLESLITSESQALLQPENIIWIEGETAGIIEYVQRQAGTDGPYITVKGRTLAGILDRRILWGQYDLYGTPPAIMHHLVNDCAITPTRGDVESRKIPGLVLLPTPEGGEKIRKQITGGTLLEALEGIGAAYNVAFGVRFNAAVPRMEFWTRWGQNRSVNQSANEPVFYSTELDDVLSSEYDYNSMNYRNVSLIAGEGEGNSRVMVVVEKEVPETPDIPEPPEPPIPPVPPEPPETEKYSISLSVDPTGSGTATGAGTYQEGESVTVEAVPGDGYKFVAWKENGVTVSENESYTFTAAANRDLVATFEAVKASRLPEGYTEVEYIQSHGTEYIDTGIKPTSTLKITMDVEPVEAASSAIKFFFDSSYLANATYKYAFRMVWDSNGVGVSMGRYTSSVSTAIISSDKSLRRMVLQMDASSKTASVDGVEKALSSNTFNTFMTALQLFTYNKSSTYALSAKLYSFQMYTGETPVRNYVSCIDPAGEVGLYDLVTEAFYGNSGTGTFTAGPAV